MRDSLGEANEVLMVGVHVSQLAVDVHHDLFLTLLLLLPEVTIGRSCFGALLYLKESECT